MSDIVEQAEGWIKKFDKTYAEILPPIRPIVVDLLSRLAEVEKERDTVHVLLDNDGSKIIRNAKDGYPDGRPDQLLTLAERVNSLCTYALDYKRWNEASEQRCKELEEKLKMAQEGIIQGIYLSACYCEGSHICTPCTFKRRFANESMLDKITTLTAENAKMREALIRTGATPADIAEGQKLYYGNGGNEPWTPR